MGAPRRLAALIGELEAEAFYDAWQMARHAWTQHMKTLPAPSYDDLVDHFANQIELGNDVARAAAALRAHIQGETE